MEDTIIPGVVDVCKVVDSIFPGVVSLISTSSSFWYSGTIDINIFLMFAVSYIGIART